MYPTTGRAHGTDGVFEVKRIWRVAAIQLPGCGSEPGANLAVAASYLRQAARAGADLAVLPELATVPYFGAEPPGRFRHLSEPIGGKSVATFARLCGETGIAAVFPFYERDSRSGEYHNSLVVIGRDGKLLPMRSRRGERAQFRKLHLATGEGLDEAQHFARGGDLGIFALDGLGLGCLICYDRRFPECWRELRALGALVVAVPIAGEGGDTIDFFLGELRTHARENGVAVIAANKVGSEYPGSMTVANYGESCVVSATGDLIARRTAAEGPGLVLAEIDLEEILRTRARLRYFEQRRLDLFAGPMPTEV